MEEKKMLNYLSFRQNTPQCWWAHSKLIRPSNGICPTSVFLLFWKSILIGLEPTTKTRLFCLKKCNTTFSTYKIQKYEILICIFCYNTCTCHLQISHNAPCLPPLSPPHPPPPKKKNYINMVSVSLGTTVIAKANEWQRLCKTFGGAYRVYYGRSGNGISCKGGMMLCCFDKACIGLTTRVKF